ncbi:MAG: S-layer homology domain-containing protein [Oscillospiraceae bacterium]|nr:S-layer homology domain-containing protein [Oscillospiraceae bacterium]
MMLRLCRRFAALGLAVVLLLTTASAALSSEHNVLYTSEFPDCALEEIGDCLGAKLERTTLTSLTDRDLDNFEEAINLFSLSLFQSLCRYCKDTYGITVTVRFCDPDGSGASAYTLFDPDGEVGDPFIGFEFFLFPHGSVYYGSGISVSTYLHEFTHFVHMVLEDQGKADSLESAFRQLNGTYPYNENYLSSNRDWNARGSQFFYRQYGTASLYEDVATLMEGVADHGDGYTAMLNSKPVWRGKYAALSSSLRTAFAPAQSAPFLSLLDADEPSPWAEEALGRARQLELLDGTLDGAYGKSITRLEFCWLASDLLEAIWGERAETHLQRSGYDLSRYTFTDVDDSAVSVMAALEVVSGRGNGRFDPNAPIKRSEAARLLALTAAALGGQEVFDGAGTPRSFSDRAAFPAWAAASIDQLSAAGVMNGVGTNFDPNGSYTREQSVTSLIRLYDYLAA